MDTRVCSTRARGRGLLTFVDVQRHIRDRLHEMGASTGELTWRWLTRFRADISPFVFRNGLDVEALKNAGLGFLMKGVRTTQHTTTFELRDPDKAEEMLARHLGMFNVRLSLELPERVQEMLSDVQKALAAAGGDVLPGGSDGDAGDAAD